MFIDTRMISRLALQRSAMFPAMNMRMGYVSLLRSEENLFELVFSKHFVPMGRGAVQNVDIVTISSVQVFGYKVIRSNRTHHCLAPCRECLPPRLALA